MTRSALALAVVCASGTLVAVARTPTPPQGTQSTAAGTVPKNKAPVAKDILKVKLPKTHEADMANGVHLIEI